MVAIRLPNSAMNPPWWASPMSSREESDRGTPYGEQSPENTAASPRHSFALPCLENAGVWGGAPGKPRFHRQTLPKSPKTLSPQQEVRAEWYILLQGQYVGVARGCQRACGVPVLREASTDGPWVAHLATFHKGDQRSEKAKRE